MPYNTVFNRANDPLNISESTWDKAVNIKFNPRLDSCIGIIGQELIGNNDLTGLHLVLLDGNNNLFDNAAALYITGNHQNGFPGFKGYQKTWVVGNLGLWDENVKIPFTTLWGSLLSNCNLQYLACVDNSGTCQANIDNNGNLNLIWA